MKITTFESAVAGEHYGKEPDWSQAPEGAMYWGAETDDRYAAWYREKDGVWECWICWPHPNGTSWEYVSPACKADITHHRIHQPMPDVQGEPAAVPAGFRVMKPTSSVVRDGERWEIYAPCGSGGIVHDDEVTDWVVRKLLDALASAPQAEQQPAPAVQGAPVGWQFYQDGKWWYGDDRIKVHRKNTEAAGIPVRDLYTTPKPADRQSVLNLSEAARSLGIAQEKGDQGAIDHWGAMVARFEREVMQPVEQQPAADGSLTPVPDELLAAEFNAWWEQHGQFCRASWRCERTFAFEAWRHLYTQPTEQKSTSCVGCEGAPVSGNSPCAVCGQKSALDVSALVEALESLLEMQDEDCRYDHQGYCQNHNLDHVDDGCRVARAKTAHTASKGVMYELGSSHLSWRFMGRMRCRANS